MTLAASYSPVAGFMRHSTPAPAPAPRKARRCQPTTGTALYADLRTHGHVTLRPGWEGLVSTARRMAGEDGYTVVTYRGTARGASTVAEDRPLEVHLTADGVHTVTPDAPDIPR